MTTLNSRQAAKLVDNYTTMLNTAKLCNINGIIKHDYSRENILKIYTVTLNSYIRGVHNFNVTSCVKCAVFDVNCMLCPEKIHEGQCIHRFTYDSSINARLNGNKLAIAYHKAAIDYIVNVPVFNIANFEQELLKIDKAIKDASNEYD